MSHEISQLEISGIQLRDSKTQPKVSHSREIGEAQIIHTIFGKAKVRIIRKHDSYWRTLWLALAFIVSATSTYFLQTWYATRQAETVRAAAVVTPPLPVAAAESVSPPGVQNEVASAALPAGVAATATPAPVAVTSPAIVQKAVPPPQTAMTTPALATPKPAVVAPKPVAIQPKAVPVVQSAVAGLPQTPSVGAAVAVPKPQALPPTAAKPLPPKQPLLPAATATVVAKTGAAASSPAVTAAPAAQDKQDAAAPIADKQLSSPVSAPGN